MIHIPDYPQLGTNCYDDGEYVGLQNSQFDEDITRSVGPLGNKVWVEVAESADIEAESNPPEPFFVHAIHQVIEPPVRSSIQKELDQILYNLVKIGDEIKEVFSAFDYNHEELCGLNAFLFSKKNLSKSLLSLNSKKIMSLDLVGKTSISVFADADEDVELVKIELDLKGSIEEKYQAISEIEEWILDYHEDIFDDIMITNTLR